MAQLKKHYTIVCLNEEIHGKGGKEIAEVLIDSNERVSYIKEEGILSLRKRFDGHWGVECMCGNDSRLAPAEKGLIGQNRPSPDAMKNIAKNLADPKKQARVKESKENKEVDGFRFTALPDVVE